ncbi:hypothetical protein [Capnocytophaga leadbetteri]|uniref:hypothetical protein n=1 Tax=Capnocytophaga leadbetteri TaxID=327575 RepID=UPI0028E765FD|nr:hypothetical protein [Capnocytophaga leadbetteri]
MMKKALFITIIVSLASFLLGGWIGFAYVDMEQNHNIKTITDKINKAKKDKEKEAEKKAKEEAEKKAKGAKKKAAESSIEKDKGNENEDKPIHTAKPNKPAAPVKSKNTLPSKEESKKEVNKDVKKEDPKEAAKKAATKSNDI